MKTTLVTSVFDWEKHSDGWRGNIVRSLKSWIDLGFDVIYCSPPVQDLQISPLVKFVEGEPFCKIKRLLEVCSLQPGMVALLDADLAIGKNISDASKLIDDKNIKMIVSRRWTYDPKENNMDNSVVLHDDHAWDFFMGDASLFLEPSKIICEGTRVAHNLWDSWLIGYFNYTLGTKVRAATKFKFLFHPRHEERNQPFGTNGFTQDRYAARAGDPKEI